MMRLTRRYQFAASHRLHSPALSPQANREIYGPCNNPCGHGHNYVLEVSVRGDVDPRTGCVVELGALDALVRRRVVAAFDHRNLNAEVAEFAAEVPTTENLARAVAGRLRAAWPPAWPRLEKIRVQETKRNSFELLIYDET